MYLLLLLFIVSSAHANDLFFEEDNNYPVKVGVETTKQIESIQSSFAKIDVYETKQCGNMLVLDESIQLTQRDNYAYHEMIAHVPLMTHPHPRKVLIIGGGDGGALTEVLKYNSVQEVTLCEIDEMVIETSKRYFPEFRHSFTDPRVSVAIEDASKYVTRFKNKFDIIIVDSPDPDGRVSVLYSYEFYQDLYNALTDNGIIVAQGESPFFHTELIKEWHNRNKQLFPHTGYYFTLVPSYPSGVIGFTYCAKTYSHGNLLNPDRSPLATLRYYTPELHRASFVLPAFLAQQLK